MRRFGWVPLILLMVGPATAQDARNEPTFEEMVRQADRPQNCDEIELDLVVVAAKRWPEVSPVVNALVHDPKNSALHVQLGNEFAKLTLWPMAERHYKCALRFNELNAHAWNNLGLMYLGTRNTDDAINAFLQAVTIDVNYARAHYHLGMAYDIHDHYDKAIASYERAISLDPRLALTRFNPQVASNPHRLELFMRRLVSEEVVRRNLGGPDE